MYSQFKTWFTSLSVNAKISGGFAIVIVLHLSIALIAHYGLAESNARLHRYDALHGETLEIAGFLEKVDRLHRRVLLFTQTGNEFQSRLARSLYDDLEQRLKSQLETAVDADSRDKITMMLAYLERQEQLFEAIVVDRAKRKRIVEVDLQSWSAAARARCDQLRAQTPANLLPALIGAQASLQTAEVAVLRFLHSPDSRFVREGKNELASARDAVRQVAASMPGRPIDANSQSLIDAIQEYENAFMQMVQATRGYLHLVNVVMAGETVEFERLTHEYRTEKLGQINRLSTAVLAESRQLQWTSTIISAITIILGVIAAGWVSREIAPPLNNVTRTLERLAAGESCERIPGLERRDEIGKLAAAAQVFKDRTTDIENLYQDAEKARLDAQQARNAAEEYATVIESTNAALEAAHESAMSATRAKSDFLANMSHEIRTPMTAILGYSELIRDEGINNIDLERRFEAIDTIHRNGKFLLQLINDILDVSKIESRKVELESIEFSPHQLLMDIRQMAAVRADDAGLSIEVNWPNDMPKAVVGDPTRLKQILINLISNAIKFTRRGAVVIDVNWRLESDDTATLAFDVTDSGIGMTQEQVDTCFDPFKQADTSTTRLYGGSGLGLTISRQLAQLMHGDVIVVRSCPGEGTTMRAAVVVALVDEPSASAPALPMHASPSHTPEIRTVKKRTDARILLAEDGKDNQRLISYFLTRVGADVTIADNGKAALDLALTQTDGEPPFDIILMDMQMPEMDGYEATRILRERGYAGPIIALTANAMDGDRQRCMDAGCDDYASKPIDFDALLDTFERHLQRSVAVVDG